MLYKKLYEHQKEAVDFAIEAKTAAIFGKQRTGKTWITLALIEHLISDSYECLLIVPLNNLETTWLKSLTTELPDLNVCRSWTDYKKAKAPKCFLLHYEGLIKCIGPILRRDTWTHIVFDESQRLKDRNSKQSRMAKRLRHKAEYKVILSGTPIEKQQQDVWAQFRFLNPTVLGDVWAEFDNEYLSPTGYMGYKRKFKEDKIESFIAAIAPYSIGIDRSVLEMPEKQVKLIRVPMFGLQAQYYNQMESTGVLWHKGKRVMANMVLTQRVRLQQICGGFLSVENEKGPPDIYDIGSAKLRKLKFIVSQIKPPFVVFCKYTHEIKMVYEALRPEFRRVEVYHGRTPKKDRPDIQRQFQAGKIDVLVCQNRTGGVGIDLYRASTAIIYSLTFSYIDFDQLISRFDLYKKETAIQIIVLIAKESIDEDIYYLVKNKEKVSERTLKQLRRKRCLRKKQLLLKKLPRKKSVKRQKPLQKR